MNFLRANLKSWPFAFVYSNMAYRFNSGLGGVTCDECYILIDQDLSFKEYDLSWGMNKVDGKDLCMECKKKLQGKEVETTLLSNL